MTARAKWRPLLGVELALRVVKLGLDDPAGWCRDAVEQAVTAAEAAKARQVARDACPHPERDRIHQRCGKCGVRGLPAVAAGRSGGSDDRDTARGSAVLGRGGGSAGAVGKGKR